MMPSNSPYRRTQMTKADLPGHAPELVRGIEDAILRTADRPRALRGPWIFDEDWLQSSAKAIRNRRALIAKEAERG